MNQAKVKKYISYLLFLVSFLLILSGFGITQYRIIEPLTFGILNKTSSFEVHSWLGLPFIILLLVHVFLRIIRR